ncbi:hypothetical protein ASG24_03365 [Methylophilus sp. Leaf414]|nr:hypothetical protein ASG24_03365 [Methylophilus sp. Leaf414]
MEIKTMKNIQCLALLSVLFAGPLMAEEGSPANSVTEKRWSPYETAQKPAVPVVSQKAWVRTPIDSFVLAKLESKQLKPAVEVDRVTFIRRATLDAWGLPPTPEEVKAFAADRSSDAYEKLVDRLLASPRFGERQARRWLDLARYADSAGFENDAGRPNNWRYRDYVIAAFNQDKPFDLFIKEQIAGDELWPDSQEAKIATGYLAGYPDNSNSRDMIQRKYQIETDIADNVSETFLATTMACARCHNHKQDKISQKEYFQFQSVFSNTVFDTKKELAKGSESVWDKQYVEQFVKYQAATKHIRDAQRKVLDPYKDASIQYQKSRYITDTLAALQKPEKEQNGLDKWINFRWQSVSGVNGGTGYLKLVAETKEHPEHTPDKVAAWDEYQRLQKELRKFDDLKPASGSSNYTAAAELSATDIPPTFVRFGGIHERPTEAVQPGLPKLWGNATLDIKPTTTSSGRRTALANWLASPENPLTARVYVNRVWAQYFDRGIISTAENFGRAGDKPTHPELLDWLATNFTEQGWSIKKLHRQILLSSVYRQSSAERPEAAKVDPENKLLATYPRKRLEAEVIRDSLLYVAGVLNEEVGGPSVLPPVTAGDQGPVDENGNRLWPVSKTTSDWNRRSIYIYSKRSLPYPMLQNFDPADPSKAHHKRDVTTTPLQALTLFNSPLVVNWSQSLAGRVINEAGTNEKAQLDRLYQVIFSRLPSNQERASLQAFLNKQENIIKTQAKDGGFAVAVPIGVADTSHLNPVRTAAFVDMVQSLVNTNEFVYRF